MKEKCDVCGKLGKVTICCSTMGAISFGYCDDCLKNGLEPYGSMVAYISGAGRFPKDINDIYQTICRNVLKKLNISEEQFIKDVDRAIADEIEAMNMKFNCRKR